MSSSMTKRAMRNMDRWFDLSGQAMDIFKLVVAEWKADPQSRQSFDSRTVEQAILIDEELRKIDPLY